MNQPFNFGPGNEGIVFAVLGGVCFFFLIYLVAAIFYLLTLQKAMSLVSPRNRLMEPGMVWLMCIPCFNIVWQFFVAVRVPDSLKNEFHDRRRDDGSDYGKSILMTRSVIDVINVVVSNALSVSPETSQIGAIVSVVLFLVNVVLVVIFWVKIAGYSRQLAEDPGRRDWDDRRFDDDDEGDGDDYPRAPREGGAASPDTFREGDAGRYKQ